MHTLDFYTLSQKTSSPSERTPRVISFLQAGHTGASVGIFKDDTYMRAPSFFQLEGVVGEVICPWQRMQDTCVSCVSVECLLVLRSALVVIFVSASSQTRPRQVLIKLENCWDKRLLLAACRKLKVYLDHKLFIREDLPPEACLSRRTPSVSRPGEPGISEPASNSLSTSKSVDSSNVHSSNVVSVAQHVQP